MDTKCPKVSRFREFQDAKKAREIEWEGACGGLCSGRMKAALRNVILSQLSEFEKLWVYKNPVSVVESHSSSRTSTFPRLKFFYKCPSRCPLARSPFLAPMLYNNNHTNLLSILSTSLLPMVLHFHQATHIMRLSSRALVSPCQDLLPCLTPMSRRNSHKLRLPLPNLPLKQSLAPPDLQFHRFRLQCLQLQFH